MWSEQLIMRFPPVPVSSSECWRAASARVAATHARTAARWQHDLASSQQEERIYLTYHHCSYRTNFWKVIARDTDHTHYGCITNGKRQGRLACTVDEIQSILRSQGDFPIRRYCGELRGSCGRARLTDS